MSDRIVVTTGDPSGIGPEVAVKALLAWPQRGRALLVGEEQSLAAAIERFAPALHVDILPLRGLEPAPVGVMSAAGGRASMAVLDAALDLLFAGEAGAVVTGPIHKGAVRAAGVTDFQGHTEYLAHRAGVEDVAMLLDSERLRVVHVSTHRSLRAATTLDPHRLDVVLELASDYAARLGGSSPRVLVAGLNPHAGEGGAFGDDEAELIAPAVERAARRRPDISFEGPISPDTCFLHALDQPDVVVVAMYHDQGHIPVKLLARDTAVNITLGLPFVRASVDHGTAHDIAGRGTANAASMRAALEAAVRLLDGRRCARRYAPSMSTRSPAW